MCWILILKIQPELDLAVFTFLNPDMAGLDLGENFVSKYVWMTDHCIDTLSRNGTPAYRIPVTVTLFTDNFFIITAHHLCLYPEIEKYREKNFASARFHQICYKWSTCQSLG